MSISYLALSLQCIIRLISIHNLGQALKDILEETRIHGQAMKHSSCFIYEDPKLCYEIDDLCARLAHVSTLKPGRETFELTRSGLKDLFVLHLTLFVVLLQFRISE